MSIPMQESVGMALLRREAAEPENEFLANALRHYDSIRSRPVNSLVGAQLIALVEHAALLHMRLREAKETLRDERRRREAA